MVPSLLPDYAFARLLKNPISLNQPCGNKSSAGEPLMKGKAKNSWPPCTNDFRATDFDIVNIIYFFIKTSSLNEEVNRTELFTISVPWCCAQNKCQNSWHLFDAKLLFHFSDLYAKFWICQEPSVNSKVQCNRSPCTNRSADIDIANIISYWTKQATLMRR
jgi:hypothetical protein